jgi:hypothetical protein
MVERFQKRYKGAAAKKNTRKAAEEKADKPTGTADKKDK